jgi:hypothetical protein
MSRRTGDSTTSSTYGLNSRRLLGGLGVRTDHPIGGPSRGASPSVNFACAQLAQSELSL